MTDVTQVTYECHWKWLMKFARSLPGHCQVIADEFLPYFLSKWTSDIQKLGGWWLFSHGASTRHAKKPVTELIGWLRRHDFGLWLIDTIILIWHSGRDQLPGMDPGLCGALLEFFQETWRNTNTWPRSKFLICQVRSCRKRDGPPNIGWEIKLVFPVAALILNGFCQKSDDGSRQETESSIAEDLQHALSHRAEGQVEVKRKVVAPESTSVGKDANLPVYVCEVGGNDLGWEEGFMSLYDSFLCFMVFSGKYHGLA